MPQSDMVYFGHMLDMARKARAKVEGISREVYDADENLRLALIHLIQIIGEAARHISPQGQQAHPEISWRSVTGMRHIIVHDYMGVDEDVIWQVVTEDLPPLIAALESIVPSEES